MAAAGAGAVKGIKDKSLPEIILSTVGGSALAGIAEIGSEECRQRVRSLKVKEEKVKALLP